MQKRGELFTVGDKIVDVRAFLMPLLERHDPAVVGYDRFRSAEMDGILDDLGYRGERVPRGVGHSAIADGSHDVRASQRLIVQGKIKVQESLLFRAGLRYSQIAYDPAGNPKLVKVKKKSRIDICQAMVIALGISSLEQFQPREQDVVVVDCMAGW